MLSLHVNTYEDIEWNQTDSQRRLGLKSGRFDRKRNFSQTNVECRIKADQASFVIP